MRKLHVDIETFSPVNLKTDGLHKYATQVELLWLSYKYDKFKVHTVDCYHEELPQKLIDDLQDPTVIKYAHNAAFEITCLSAVLGVQLDPSQWRCTMGLCYMAGLPGSLDESTRILGVAQKDPMGISYIRTFSAPCKPTKNNGQRIRNLPSHLPEKWEAYGRYNNNDVVAEAALEEALEIIFVSDFEREVWALDQKVNNHGIFVDMPLVYNAININNVFKERLTEEAIKITGLVKPNSVKALKKWIEQETDSEIENLQKKNIPKLIAQFDNEIITRVLNIREQLSKTSIAKYNTMVRAAIHNNNIRGLFQYCGAGRTWRFAGRLVQLQNLVKGKYIYREDLQFDDLDLARTLLRNSEYEMLELLYGSVPDTLSQLLRTAIIPSKGKKFAIIDFSAIEARILAWLANEPWRLEVFNTHGKIYEASAAKILKKDIKHITKNERSKFGKIPELAAGYAGGVNAYIKFGALDVGILEKDIQPMVDAWRTDSPNIVRFWAAVNKGAIKAIHTGEVIRLYDMFDREGQRLVTRDTGIEFSYRNRYLMIKLPSGHSLYYYNATLVPGKFGGVQIQYWSMDQTTKKWCRNRTYGGKLTENICQAIGRDCLVNGMVNLDKAGYDITLHVHDETGSEVDEDASKEVLEEMIGLLCKKAPWMKGLPLKAEGFFSNYYRKE